MANATISPHRPIPNPPVDFLLTQHDEQLALPVDQSVLKFSKEADLFVGNEEAERLKREENDLFGHASQEKKLLLEELIKYHERKNLSEAATPAVPNVKCSWDKVTAVLAQLSKDEESSDNKLKRWIRSIGENADIFQRWLTLLPDGDYGATVCGAFHLVLGAAKRSSDVRSAAFEALSEIPDVIQRAAEYTYIYAAMKPKRLVEKTAELCSAVLIALRHIVRYFGEGSWNRARKVIVMGSTFKEDMVKSLSTIKKLAANLDEEARIASQRRLQVMQSNLEVIYHDASGARSIVQQGFSNLQSEDYLDRQAAKIGNVVYERLVNQLMFLFADNPIYDPRTGKPLDVPSVLRQVKSSEAILSSGSDSSDATRDLISVSGLIRLLRPSRLSVGKDVQRLVESAHSLNLRQQERVKWIMTSSPKLREWLTGLRSRALLINGNSNPNEIISPTTFLAGKLLETLQRMEHVISIYYFCSLHTSTTREPKANGIGMLRCLLVQLLEARKTWDLSFLDRDDLNDLDVNDVEALCKLFHNLIKRLPEKTILFCVIDAVNFYERDDKRDDFLAVIDQLVLEIEQSRKITIKLLITCPFRSMFVKDYIEDEDDVELVPERIDGDGQGWSNFTWHRTMGREVERLSIENE